MESSLYHLKLGRGKLKISNGLYDKFLRIECAVCGEDEYLDFMITWPEFYEGEELLYIDFTSLQKENLFKRIKNVFRERKFSKNYPHSIWIEVVGGKHQLEHLQTLLVEKLQPYDIEDELDSAIKRYQESEKIYIPFFDIDEEKQIFKSKEGLQILLSENDPINNVKIGYSVNEYIEKGKSILWRYIRYKDWGSPFEKAYFSLTREEVVDMLASISVELKEM